jgi:hypothetical protein
MLERHIQFVKVEQPDPAETAGAARTRLGEKFPRTAVRRMTHLGLLLGSTLDGLTLGLDDALVYATTYSETRALEDYLASFPTASPLLFQTSIHPGAVQQVMIARQQPVGRFWPMTGQRRLVEQALLTALLEPAPRVVLVGGEERGTWMLTHGRASDRPFAFALALASEAAGAVGRISFAATPPGAPLAIAEACPTLPEFTAALAGRTPLGWLGAGGHWSLTWA